MLVELQAENSDRKFLSNSYCRVDFLITSDRNIVRVPATALMSANRGMQVAVLGADNKVVLKPIQLGRDFGDTVEVKAGLAPQDRGSIHTGDIAKRRCRPFGCRDTRAGYGTV